MIRSQQYAILSSKDVKKNRLTGVTRIYIRFYHSFIRKQLPKKSELNCGKNPVQGDPPVIEYRRMRQTLKDKNN
jgi:hypothetical protein